MNGRVFLMTTAAALALAAVASSARADGLVDDAKAVVEKASSLAGGPHPLVQRT